MDRNTKFTLLKNGEIHEANIDWDYAIELIVLDSGYDYILRPSRHFDFYFVDCDKDGNVIYDVFKITDDGKTEQTDLQASGCDLHNAYQNLWYQIGEGHLYDDNVYQVVPVIKM